MIKKIISFFILAMMIVFLTSGCRSENKSENEITTMFSADFDAEYKDMTIQGSIVAGVHGNTEIKFTYPETISGLSVTYKEGDIQLGINSLQSTADETYLPDESLPKIIYSVVNVLMNIGDSVPENAENYTTYQIDLSQGKCDLTVNSNGFLTEADIKDKDVKIIFYNHLITNY